MARLSVRLVVFSVFSAPIRSAYKTRAPAVAGAFYFFIHPQPAPNGFRYLAPLLSTQPGNKPSKAMSAKSKNPGHTKTNLKTSLLTSALIPSTHSPITSLPIAITDAIGSSKSHGNLIPLVRDLIEATIKRKRQLLLPLLTLSP